MADIPDFGSLVRQQQQQDDDATRRSTWANRPDQSNALGSVSWNQDASGRWINNTSLSGGAQGLFDQTMGGSSNLAGQVGAGLSSDGLMGWGNTDLTRGAVAMPDSGFGASQQVIDAWNALQQPGLNKDAEAARARAAAMGMTLGSQGWGDVENTIGTNNRQAANEGILRGTQEYQNVFNRGMASRQQTVAENTKQAELMNAMRGQQFGERQTSYDAALKGLQNLTGVRDSLNPNKWNTNVPTAAQYKPLNLLGAAQETFNAQTSNENQATANRNSNINSGINALQAMGGLTGVGSALGGAWDWAKNQYNSYTGAYNPAYQSGGYSDYNDFTGINGNNAFNTWATYGSGGD